MSNNIIPPFEELLKTYKPYLDAASKCGSLTVEELIGDRKIANNCDWRKIVVHTLRVMEDPPISYGHLTALFRKVKHSAAIYMFKVAKGYLDPKFGDEKFIGKYKQYQTQLKKQGLNHNKTFI